MFNLVTIHDIVNILPADFGRPPKQVITTSVNAKYANRIIHQVGLCISFYDLLTASDGETDPGVSNGSVFVSVSFRMLVFRPFKGEILHGRIAENTEKGIRLSLEFFDDIIIPPTLLFDGSVLIPPTPEDPKPVWVWINQDAENPEEQKYYFDAGQMVRWRVEEEVWQDQAPQGPVVDEQQAGNKGKDAGKKEKGAAAAALGVAKVEEPGAELGVEERERLKEERCPYRLVGSMRQPGLGCVEWW